MTGVTLTAPGPVDDRVVEPASAVNFQRSYWDGLSTVPGLAPVIDPADATGEKNTRIDRRHQIEFRRFIRRAGVRRARRVLDFGCGIGRHYNLLTSLADHYVGVDIAAGMLARAPGETHLIDGAYLPFDDASFDLIVSFWVLQHVVDDATLATIAAEFRRCLAPGGKVVVCERSLPTTVEPGRPAAYIRGRAPSEYERVFAAQGLRPRCRRRLTYGPWWRAMLRPALLRRATTTGSISMHSPRERTVVMTEVGSFFLYHFPILLRDRRFRIDRIVFSEASADRLRSFLDGSWWHRIRTIARAIRRERGLGAARSYLYLLRHRARVSIYDPVQFEPIPTDYLCSLGFMRRIPETQLLATRTSSNVHWSLLPRYRGCDPLERARRDDVSESGVTIHRIDAGFDTGDVLIQRRFSIAPGADAAVVRRTARDVSRELFTRYLRGKPLFDRLPRPQSTLEIDDTSGIAADRAPRSVVTGLAAPEVSCV